MLKPNFIDAHLLSRTERDDSLLEWMRARLDYEAHTGNIVERVGRRVMTTRAAGKRGRVKLNGMTVSSAVAVWFWHHGTFPPGERFRRVNGDITDDRIDNLGLKSLDGAIEGAGKRWAIRIEGTRYGPFRSYEKALEAYEKGSAAAKAFLQVSDLV